MRLARGATGRNKIIKFEGCYHGHADALLVKAGSGLATFGHPTSAGRAGRGGAGHPGARIQQPRSSSTRLSQLHGQGARLRDDRADRRQHELRAGEPGALHAAAARAVHRSTARCWCFDEVMSGFRVALGSAQSLYAQAAMPGFAPDLSVFGKVIGGGMPLAAFGGLAHRSWSQLAPARPGLPGGHAQSGNPVATACGLATLREIRKPGFFEALSTQVPPPVDRRPGQLAARAKPTSSFVGDCLKAACSASSSRPNCRRTTAP